MCVVHGAHEPRVALKGCVGIAKVLQREKRDGQTKLFGYGRFSAVVVAVVEGLGDVGNGCGGGGSLTVLVHERPWRRRYGRWDLKRMDVEEEDEEDDEEGQDED